MITSRKGALPMERCFFTDSSDSSYPVLIYDLIVVPDGLLLFVCFLRDDLFSGGSSAAGMGGDGVVAPDCTSRRSRIRRKRLVR
jgi:hypothetical protein